MKRGRQWVLATVFAASSSVAALALDSGQTETITARDVYVWDGDTIRVKGETYRLVDFDAPEIDPTARCKRRIELGYQAKARVVDLVHEAKTLTLRRGVCSCAPSAPEGSRLCNYARRYGTFRAQGEDVGCVLIRDGLAKPYPYSWYRAPK